VRYLEQYDNEQYAAIFLFWNHLVSFYFLKSLSDFGRHCSFFTAISPHWTAKTMAEVQSAEAMMGKDINAVTDKIKEFIEEKEDKVELPQDYLFSPTGASSAINQVDSPCETFSKSDSETTAVVTNKHVWVSPNKSDEIVPSLMECPSNEWLKFEVDESNAHDLIKKLRVDLEAAAAEENLALDFDDENATGFDAAIVDSSVDLSVIGKRLEIQTYADDVAEAVLHASSKSFANIIHGEKQVMLVLPSRVSTS
jgi:hypothetical protein